MDRVSDINLDIERSVLGGILLNNAAYEQASYLRPLDFSLSAHQRIFLRMAELYASRRPIDLVTLEEALYRHKELESVGGLAYLSSLVDGVPNRPSIAHYVQIIREAANRRRGLRILDEGQRRMEDPSVAVSAIAEIGSRLVETSRGTDPLPPRFSEEALALRFSQRYADDLRYVSPWGQWMRWDGLRWVKDNTLYVFNLARGICREASAECGDDKERAAMKIAASQTVVAIERLARADRRHAAMAESWDVDPWLLNTPIGTVDLRTGKIAEHSPSDHMTKITVVSPSGDCPQWCRFLRRVTEGNADLQLFLQRVVGYCLTGVTREHALFFLFGTGANGKSVFLSTISELLGDYAKTAPASLFTASPIQQHPTDLAGLRGARFITANETEEGAGWAEAKIKLLTGGDKICARLMRQDFFEFTPEFKLVIAGNHKPGFRTVDEAIRRRLHLIPFTVTIPENERDATLVDKLRTELPGILAWCIQGCLDWRHNGLNPPAIVRNATNDYLAAEDSIGTWIGENCVEERSAWTPGSDLYSNYKTWCEKRGEKAMSQKRLSQALENRGYAPKRTGASRGFEGVSLRGRMTHVTGFPFNDVTHTHGRPI